MFSSRLKSLRQQAGLSQRALAEKLFVSQQAVARWETDKATPNPEMLAKIAEILNISVDELLGREDSQPEKIDKSALKAAFWGGEKDLSQEELDDMWNDVERFAAFLAEKKRQEKKNG